MGNFFKILHSFNAGDCLSILPGIKKQYEEKGTKTLIYQRLDLPAGYYLGATHSTLNAEGQGVCMNQALFDMLRPLLLEQEYIEDFKVWHGEPVDLNYDLTRESNAIPMPAGSIHHWPSLVFPEMVGDYWFTWLSVMKKRVTENFTIEWEDKKYIPVDGFEDYIIVNRTERYQNPYISYYFLEQYKDRIIFSGTKKEYESFCKQWNLSIPLLIVKDFWELAQAIKMCKFFIGNQSVNFHIADAMKVNRIVEICNQFPNTWPTGSNGFCFTRQQALEFYTNKLINA